MEISPFIIPIVIYCLIPIIAILTYIAAYKHYKFVRPHKAVVKWITGSGTGGALTVFIAGTIILVNTIQAQKCQPTSLLAPSKSLQCTQGNINVGGSTALEPLATHVADQYQASCINTIINVDGGGTEAGLDHTEDGSIQIGDSDGPAPPIAKYADLVQHPVAIVTFALIVNQSTGITTLSTDQIKCIYNEKCTSWKDVGGAEIPIVALSRFSGSGTRSTFEQYVLGGLTKITHPDPLPDTNAVISKVEHTSGAIGYVAYPSLQNTRESDKDQIQVIDIDGNSPSNSLVENDTYKFWNIEYMYTKGPAQGLTKAFIDYMSNDDVTKYIGSHSFISLKDGQNVLMHRCEAGGV